jgi:hypothetical protein
MAEKCTNTSSPVERWINPYPFAPLNHFTVPFSLTAETPFTIAKNSSPAFSIVASVVPKPPSQNPVELSVGQAECDRTTPKKEKTPQFSTAVSSAEGTSGVSTIWCVSTTTTNVNHCIGLTTGPLPGIEPQIIRPIKTIRNKN